MEFEHWKNNDGGSPVDKFLDGLPRELLAWIINKAEYYTNLSSRQMLSLGFIEKCGKGLQELKFKTPRKFIPIRMLYSMRADKNIIFHAFSKNYDGSIKRKEIKLASERLKLLDTDPKNQKINGF